MLNILLTQKQKSTLELRHKKFRDKRECDRIKAVLLSDKGWLVEMIAHALRIHETSISRHINEFIKTEKLTLQSGGSGGI
ncbi:MAG: putative ArsR family transcriptional regulator [Psychromonas sp.]|jgi:predicted ArsR family transcriptional regulator